MISSEVQRTLVKSPPELWAEISDPDSLARHLGEFGEIRITRVQPEQKVEWETDVASGTVVIKPSGWGTKVKLTVTRELAELVAQADAEAPAGTADAAEQTAGEQEPGAIDAPELGHAVSPEGAPELDDELESDLDDATIPDRVLKPEPLVEPESHAEPAEVEQQEEAEPLPPEPEPEPRRGFFARLFGRRRTRSDEPSADALAEPEPLESEPISEGLDLPRPDLELDTEITGEHAPVPSEEADEQPLDAPEDSAGPSEQQAQADDAAAQAKLAEELAAEEVTAVLTGVLDRLGAAHHRPFSRA